MRKMMTKEVTFTTLRIAKMEVADGKPVVVQLPDELILGTIKPAKAQKRVNKKYHTNVTIFDSFIETRIYEMPVAEFIKVATIQTEENTEELNETDEIEEITETDEVDEAEEVIEETPIVEPNKKLHKKFQDLITY